MASLAGLGALARNEAGTSVAGFRIPPFGAAVHQVLGTSSTNDLIISSSTCWVCNLLDLDLQPVIGLFLAFARLHF